MTQNQEKLLSGITTEYRNALPLLSQLSDLIVKLGERRLSASASISTPVEPLSVVELGAGTCEHAVFFTHHLGVNPTACPLVRVWQATDLEEANKRGESVIAEYRKVVHKPEMAPESLLPPPAKVDAREAKDWKALIAQKNHGIGYDVVFTSCTFHMIDWNACVAAIENVGRIALSDKPESFFAIYGPLNYDGKYTSESNAKFDKHLREAIQGGACIKDFEKIRDVAKGVNLEVSEDIEMPENNRLLVLRRPHPMGSSGVFESLTPRAS